MSADQERLDLKPDQRVLYRFWAAEPGHEDQEWTGWWEGRHWVALYGGGLWSPEFVTRWEPEADAEQTELRAEIEHLRRWKAEATEVILGLQDLGKALGLGLGERITGEVAAEAAKGLTVRAEQAESERDEVSGRLSALLCDLTGGRLSKPTYDVPTMVQEIEEYLTRELEIDAAAERDKLRAALAKVRALADDADLVPVNVGGGNLVSRRRLVPRGDLLAALIEVSE